MGTLTFDRFRSLSLSKIERIRTPSDDDTDDGVIGGLERSPSDDSNVLS